MLQFLAERLGAALDRASQAMPGGGWGLLVLLLLLVGVVVAIRLRVGPLTRTASLDRSLELTGQIGADEHRLPGSSRR